MLQRCIIFLTISLFLVFLQSCNNAKKENRVTTFQDTLLQYLKNDLRIKIDTDSFETEYVKFLFEKQRSLIVDSLLLNNTSVKIFPSKNIRLLSFVDDFRYKSIDASKSYTIYFLQDIVTGKFYMDWIDDRYSYIIESFCSYSYIKNLEENNSDSVDLSDKKQFNSISSTRTFGEYELSLLFQKRGLEQLLNDRYRYEKTSEAELDELFKCYDGDLRNASNRIFNARELLKKMSLVKDGITSRDNKFDKERELVYLKDQFSLLMLKQATPIYNEANNKGYYLRIFDSGQNIFVREVTTTGTPLSGYRYYIKEYSLCF